MIISSLCNLYNIICKFVKSYFIVVTSGKQAGKLVTPCGRGFVRL